MRDKNGRFIKGFCSTPTTQFKKGMASWNKGLKLGKNIAHSKRMKGRIPWNKGKKMSKELKERASEYWSGRPKPYRRGDKNHFWKGGITPINHKIRMSLEYKQWREAIYKRDDFTCQMCGRRGFELNADHIKPFSLYPELRFELDNGRTLCVPCHRQTDTWGVRTSLGTIAGGGAG